MTRAGRLGMALNDQVFRDAVRSTVWLDRGWEGFAGHEVKRRYMAHSLRLEGSLHMHDCINDHP